MGVPFDADDKDELGLVEDVEGAILLAEAGETDFLALSIAVLFDIGFGALEDDASLFFLGLWSIDVLVWLM